VEFKISVFNKEDAAKHVDWIKNRGGVAVWEIQLIGGGPNNTKSYSTPARKLDGSPMDKPHWSVGNQPNYIITDPAEISVVVPKEVNRFHVALGTGRQGMMLKCSDASSRKIRERVLKAGEGAWHEFDYSTQEAVIFAPDLEISLKEWMEKNAVAKGE